MKRLAIVFIALALLVGGRAAHAADLKLGVVDLIKALNESDAGKKAKSELETLIKAKQSSIDEKGKEIEKLKSSLEKQASVLSSDARKTKEEELERLVREYQRVVSDSQNDVKKKESDFTGEILKEIRAIIEKTGQEEGYTLIIENAEGIVLFAKKDLDLTESIIRKFNEAKKQPKKK